MKHKRGAEPCWFPVALQATLCVVVGSTEAFCWMTGRTFAWGAQRAEHLGLEGVLVGCFARELGVLAGRLDRGQGAWASACQGAGRPPAGAQGVHLPGCFLRGHRASACQGGQGAGRPLAGALAGRLPGRRPQGVHLPGRCLPGCGASAGQGLGCSNSCVGGSWRGTVFIQSSNVRSMPSRGHGHRRICLVCLISQLMMGRLAKQITEQLKAKQYADAEKSWRDLESAVQENSNGVNFYNFLKDESSENAATTQRKRSFASFSKNGYSKCLSSNVTREGDLDGLMNTVIKNKLRIIPKNVSWREQSDDVFEALAGDFMKPRIHEVDELLKLGVDVTIYSGQPKTKAYTYI